MSETVFLEQIAEGTMHLKNSDAWHAILTDLKERGYRGTEQMSLTREIWQLRKMIRRSRRGS